MSTVQQEYETLPYPHYVHPLSDPARLAVLGRIFGLKPADPRHARVIELGCGSGSNLLGLAARLPGSRFLGLDFSAPDIESARQIATEAGLKNVEFHQADLLTWTPPAAKFDYLIAYGLFSWVPDPVKDRVLQLCRACLGPQGIACVSYMTYPGCKQADALRDLLLLRTAKCETSEAKLTAAQGLLGFLEGAYGIHKDQPQALSLQAEVRKIRAKEPRFLLHDDLGSQRDPCYLMQFVGWAAEHGLRYLAECEFHTMLVENLPPENARELLALKLDRLETEQILDYVTNRSFRCSLLVGPEAPTTGRLVETSLRELYLSPVLQPESPHGVGEVVARFHTATGGTVEIRSGPLCAFLRYLATHPGAFTPFGDLLAETQKSMGREFTPAEQTRLLEDLLTLYGRGQLALSAAPFAPRRSMPERPRLSSLNQVLTRRRGMLVTATQKSMSLTGPQQQFVALLDGHRMLSELRRSREGLALGEALEPLLRAMVMEGCVV